MRAHPAVRLAIALLIALAAGHLPAQTNNPLGIRSGNARFEFLTASLLRMEYSPSGAFVDAPTAVVQKRAWPAVSATRSEKDGWLTLATSAMTVRYRLQSGAFGAGNLEVSWKDHTGATRVWHPGDVDARNLGGLTYSLDNISKDTLPKGQTDLESPMNDAIPGIDLVLGQAKPGLLSRSGFAFIDDSGTPVANAQRTWIEPRGEEKGEDWYLFTYDRDYPQVLQTYAELCGAIPMVPRFVLGTWVTDFNFEYFPGSLQAKGVQTQRYNQARLVNELSRLRQERIPFDTLVLDFAWHNYGWDGGYDWSPLLDHPDELLQWLRKEGIKLSLNDHPGYINTDESNLSFSDTHASAVLAALGRAQPPKATFDLDVSQHWQFATDPHDQGLTRHWYAAGQADAHWQPDPRRAAMGGTAATAATMGSAAYRTTVRLPAERCGRSTSHWVR